MCRGEKVCECVCVREREREGVCICGEERKKVYAWGRKRDSGWWGDVEGGGGRVCVHCVICLCAHTQLKLLYFCCNPGRDECCGSHKLRKETSRLQV